MKKIVFLALTAVFIFSACSMGGTQIEKMSLEEAKVFATDFIDSNLLKSGDKSSIKEVVEENGIYKVVLNLPDGKEYESYMTLDGKKFFIQGVDTETIAAEKADQEAATVAAEKKTLADVTKKDIPEVELFVMSHCPYGTQIEKGILPALDLLGDKIDFTLKFCDYAMHDTKEIDEQLNQYCIQKNYPDKLIPYLYCFLEADDGQGCISSTGINAAAIKSCVASTDKEFGISDSYADKSTWKGSFPSFDVYKEDNAKYGVKGSPSFVLNGNQVSTGRDSASLLKAVCAGFNEAPSECDQVLSSTSPAPGFGFDGSGSNSAASCGN